MKIERKYLKILSIILVANLVGFLIYLSLKNYKSEVFIDFKASKIKFVAREGSQNELLTNLEFFSNVVVDSVQLSNSNLLFKPAVADGPSPSRQLSTERMDVVISGQKPFIFKDFNVPKDAEVTLSRGDNYILIEVYADESNMDIVSGMISLGENDSFILSGQDMKFAEPTQESLDQRRIVYNSSKIYRNIRFSSKRKFAARLFTTNNNDDVLLKNLQVNKVETIDIDRSDQTFQKESTLQSGNIEISGISFSKKKFLLEEYILESGDFLRINDKDNYFIKEMLIAEDGFKTTIEGLEVKGLEAGRTINSINSISPSKLDFLIAEPYKNTLWKVIAFIIAQEFLVIFWGPLKNLIGIKNE